MKKIEVTNYAVNETTKTNSIYAGSLRSGTYLAKSDVGNLCYCVKPDCEYPFQISSTNGKVKVGINENFARRMSAAETKTLLGYLSCEANNYDSKNFWKKFSNFEQTAACVFLVAAFLLCISKPAALPEGVEKGVAYSGMDIFIVSLVCKAIEGIKEYRANPNKMAISFSDDFDSAQSALRQIWSALDQPVQWKTLELKKLAKNFPHLSSETKSLAVV